MDASVRTHGDTRAPALTDKGHAAIGSVAERSHAAERQVVRYVHVPPIGRQRSRTETLRLLRPHSMQQIGERIRRRLTLARHIELLRLRNTVLELPAIGTTDVHGVTGLQLKLYARLPAVDYVQRAHVFAHLRRARCRAQRCALLADEAVNV